jgi:phosphohistidine swiveling domain-containing protein
MMLEVPAFMAAQPACAGALHALRAAGHALMVKGRPVDELPADFRPCFSHALVDVDDDGVDPASAAAGTTGRIVRVRGPVHSAADLDAALARGAVAVVGWPIDGTSSGARVAAADIAVVTELMQRVEREEPVERLEAVIRKDPQLAFRLIRHLNSAAYGLAIEVSTFRHALMLMGYGPLKRWLALLLVTAGRDPALRPAMFAAVRRGLLMEEAAASSHAAIVARALGIPAIGGIENLTTRIEQGDYIIVDAEEGTVHVRPDDVVYDAYKARVGLRSERQARYAALKGLPAQTLDGTHISLMLNAGLDLDLDMLDQAGADGVGLFRTEFQFLVSETLPRLDDQITLYQRVLERAAGRPVVFRTLDLGGDKVLPALNLQREENPALGWRSIRFALDHKGLFRRQLRALVRAAGDGPLTVMFPMVTVPSEYHAAKALLLEEIAWTARQTGKQPSKLEVGVMLETPALGFSMQDLVGEVDFLSVGTNDLLQFFFAADRMTPSVSERYDLVDPAALRYLKMVADTCKAGNIRLSVCGEATASPPVALCFAALGYTSLSMAAFMTRSYSARSKACPVSSFQE